PLKKRKIRENSSHLLLNSNSSGKISMKIFTPAAVQTLAIGKLSIYLYLFLSYHHQSVVLNSIHWGVAGGVTPVDVQQQ
ncbi:MAG: hypothetical protein QXL51_01250, partial [Candidatus Aenigmatarchaeota archaeon]